MDLSKVKVRTNVWRDSDGSIVELTNDKIILEFDKAPNKRVTLDALKAYDYGLKYFGATQLENKAISEFFNKGSELYKQREEKRRAVKLLKKAEAKKKKESTWIPCTQEYWMSCKFGFYAVKKTGYGYTWGAKPVDELPKDLQDFRYNEKFTIKEFHQYVGEHYNAYAEAGKIRVAFQNLKARIAVYNEGIRENATDIHNAVDRADTLLNQIIYGQRKNLQKQIQDLRAACIKLGVKPKLLEALLDKAADNLRLRDKVLLQAKDLELELPAIDVTTLETWMVPQLQGYSRYDVYSDELPAVYTEEERKVAPRNTRAIRWVQDITKALTPQREDLLVLMTLYITQADGNTELFYRHDKFGDKIERDMRPAPITEDEIREWKAYYEEEENKKLNTPIEWVSR